VIHNQHHITPYIATRPIVGPEDWAECAGLWAPSDLYTDDDELLFLNGTSEATLVIDDVQDAAGCHGVQSGSGLPDCHDEQTTAATDQTVIWRVTNGTDRSEMTDGFATCDKPTDTPDANITELTDTLAGKGIRGTVQALKAVQSF
jgi:hypothetical protein